MNNVNLLGRFGKDPELRFFEGSGGQNAVAKFSLAVDERVKRDGQWVKQPVWVNCEAWGKLASDVIGKYCQKGTQVAITRSEEHTSELQSPCNLVCRLLLEKKKKNKTSSYFMIFNLGNA